MATTGWERPHFQKGGGNPFLLFVAYGDFSGSVDLEERHRCRGIPKGCMLGAYPREKDPTTFETFLKGLLGRWLGELGPEVEKKVRSSTTALILRGKVQDPGDLEYLRDAIGLLSALLESGGHAILDGTSFQWWLPAVWRKDVFEPDAARPVRMSSILVSDDPKQEGRSWIHTRGMRKFGRPDIGIHGVPASGKEAALDLCERFIEMQALGAVVPDGQPIRVAGLPPGMRCSQRGSLEDPDYNNFHISIEWPPG